MQQMGTEDVCAGCGPAIVTIIERQWPLFLTSFTVLQSITACHVNIHSPVYCVLTILVSIFMKQLVKTHNYLHQFVFSIINRTLHIVSIRLCYFAMGPQQAFLKVLCTVHTIRIWYVHTSIPHCEIITLSLTSCWAINVMEKYCTRNRPTAMLYSN